ncbi:MAG TPA: helix-turn-helix domain-containing protein, partial [Solirubrobacterales bacterium]|nr:helix-turn-helix domain-containing protein [Solirubrobacterales bacterium]
LGVALEPPTKAVRVIPRGGEEDGRGAEELADRLQRRLEDLRLSHLATRRAGGLCLLAKAEPARLRELLGELIAKESKIVVGCGREVHSPAEVSASLRDAQLAVERIGAPGSERLLDFADLDLGSFLVGSAATDAIAPKVEEVLRPLRENEPLLDTLSAYFEHDLSVVPTARALRIHPNSLRYRLGRIEELTGRSLREPATIATLHLALLASAADGAPSGADG